MAEFVHFLIHHSYGHIESEIDQVLLGKPLYRRSIDQYIYNIAVAILRKNRAEFFIITIGGKK